MHFHDQIEVIYDELPLIYLKLQPAQGRRWDSHFWWQCSFRLA